MKFNDTQISFLEDSGLFLNEKNNRLELDTRATGLNPLMFITTEFRGNKYTYDEAKALEDSYTYVDCETGEVYSDFSVMREAAIDLMNEALEQARIYEEE